MKTNYLKLSFMVIGIIAMSIRSFAQLPDPGFVIDGTTAIVITDPQNDFLSPEGVTWGLVGESVTKNGTVENLETLFKLGKEYGIPVFISPHYYYKHDHTWKFEGALELAMHNMGMFDRGDQLNSMSTSSVRKPRCAYTAARLIAHVVLPHPPFWLTIAMIRTRSPRLGVERAGHGTSVGALLSRQSRIRIIGTPLETA